MRLRFPLCITVLLACHPLLWPQALTNQFPPAAMGAAQRGAKSEGAQNRARAAMSSPPAKPQDRPEDVVVNESEPVLPGAGGGASQPAQGPARLSVDGVPIAEPEQPEPVGVPVHIAADRETKRGDLYTLDGHVEIDYQGYVVRADTALYNTATDAIEAEGHLQLEGGRDQEEVSAEHGTINLREQTAHFYNVVGSIRLARPVPITPAMTGLASSAPAAAEAPPNPLIFTGREVLKDGPDRYRVIDGSVTSCQLPRPDWRLAASRILLDESGPDGGRATARNTRFTLLGVPVFFLPYATHPIDTRERQSGFLIPTFGVSSSKGTIFGEEYFWAINRSMDLTLGSEYYSARGFAPRGEFRLRGRDLDFLTIHFHSLLDRRTGEASSATGRGNQGGTDLLVDGRRDFSSATRGVLDLEYLSSYVYRQAFEENFSIAISSEVKSQAFVTHQADGISESLSFERYQSFENNTPLTEIRILHTPTLSAEAVDHQIPDTPLVWRFSVSLGGLSRSEPGLQRVGEVRRIDLYPHLELPLSFRGWNFRPEFAVRETAYSRSQLPGVGLPVVRDASLNRGDVEAGFELHPPIIERDFSPPWLLHLLGGGLRHSIEEDVRYRYVTGVDHFTSVLRFDDTDIVSNTNEVEYSLTQRLFLRQLKEHQCGEKEAPREDGNCGGGTVDWLSWSVAQKYFFDPQFGGAVVTGTRNVLDTTLDLTGVAFLTQPRFTSPVISRVRLRTTSATDLEWDLDYDPKLGRITSSDLFAAYHHDGYAFALSHAKLDAPEPSPTSPQNLASAVSNYNQLRVLFSYGASGKRGFSAGANGGYDFTLSALQFGGVQSAYNWNCCGLSLEYRRYNLGSVRNENQYLYSFSLAGIGTAGNLRRAVRIF
ncbi:MAG TPA: LPS assembly protein LptD [Acidisarcina sp.]